MTRDVATRFKGATAVNGDLTGPLVSMQASRQVVAPSTSSPEVEEFRDRTTALEALLCAQRDACVPQGARP
jgi:hypothetical protein